MKMDEASEMIKWHPLLIKVSEKPATWYGFLKIHNDTRIEMKLKVPNYPELKAISLQFGKQFDCYQSAEFKSKVKQLAKNSSSVLSFLRQLQGFLEETLKKDENRPGSSSRSSKNFLDSNMLDELATILTIPDIEVLGNGDLSSIKIKYKSVSITLRPELTKSSPWALISSDLPELSEWQPFEKCVNTLADAVKAIKLRVDALEDTWRELESIDENCWVIDPINPNPSHLYRRIQINPSLSLLIKINPLHAENYPEIKLLGSDKEVFKYREILSENLCNWDSEKTIPENILELLSLDEFPLRPIEQPKDVNAICDDEECCICFSMESEEGDLPTEICSNEKCRKYFHSSCLLQWLQTEAGKQMYFDRCHGTCPVCNENISCAIKVR